MALRIIQIAGALLVLILFSSACWYVVEPGERGIIVTLGKVNPVVATEGFGTKFPFITSVKKISIRQQTEGFKTEAFSSDLQHMAVTIKVLYRIPEAAVIPIFTQYHGDPFESLVYPRVSEALKEVTALRAAEAIVKNREQVKAETLSHAQDKIGSIIHVEDIVIEDIALSNELSRAIEQKMVQEQEAAKAQFAQQQVQIEAKTAIIRAEGEAKAINIRGEALRQNPRVIDLQIVEKWNGVSPLVVGDSKANILLPIRPEK